MPILPNKIIEASSSYENNPALIDQIFHKLREWLATQTHLPQVSHEMLKQFHHSCYFDFESTKKCILNYYDTRSSAPDCFTGRDLDTSELIQTQEVLRVALLPAPDPRGYRILYAGLKDPDPSKFNFAHVNRLYLMCLEAAQHRHGRLPGLVPVFDMQAASLTHLAKCSLWLIRKVALYTQDGLPLRIPELHVVNTLPWLHKIISIVGLFIRKETLSKVSFHTSNLETLVEHLPPKCLPEDLGGTLPCLATLEADTIEYIRSLKDYFTKEEKSRQAQNNTEKQDIKILSDIPKDSRENLEID